MLKLEVTESYENVRVDRVARDLMKEFTLSYIFSSFRKGKIKVNGKKVEQNYRLQLGDSVVFFDLQGEIEKKTVVEVVSHAECEKIASQIVFQNEDFLLFNKHGNQVIHTGSDHEAGIIEVLKQYFQNPDLTAINRLDKPTLGLVLIGKTKSSIRKLSEYLRDDLIEKRYLALCQGEKRRNFVISKPLLVEEERVTVSQLGKESRTGVNFVLSNANLHLLELELFTGRKHQIRVHLASEKLPIVGDYKYGVKYGKMMYLAAYYIAIRPLNFAFELTEIKEKFKEYLNRESR